MTIHHSKSANYLKKKFKNVIFYDKKKNNFLSAVILLSPKLKCSFHTKELSKTLNFTRLVSCFRQNFLQTFLLRQPCNFFQNFIIIFYTNMENLSFFVNKFY